MSSSAQQVANYVFDWIKLNQRTALVMVCLLIGFILGKVI